MGSPQTKSDGGSSSRDDRITRIKGYIQTAREEGELSRKDAIGLIESTVLETAAVAVVVSDLTRDDVSERLHLLAEAFADEDGE